MSKLEEVYEYIVEYTLTHQYVPSIREIGKGVGLKSTQSVDRYMKMLFSDGSLQSDIDGVGKRAYRVKDLEIRRKV